MNKNLNILYLLAGVFSVLGFTALVPNTKAFAQSSVNNINKSMVQNMKDYHGVDWKQDCNEMMNDIDDST
jgi:hypothetical protein